MVRSDNDLDLVISPELAREIEMRKQTVNFSVSVTVIDHQVSFLRWKHEDQQYEAWSNIDFNHLLGFGEFRVGEKIYSPWFGVENVNYSANEIRDWLGSPPIFANAAYSYVVTKGNANNLEAVEGIEALHKLYRHKSLELKSAYEARERVRKERAAYLEANPPKPQNVEVQFWKRERTEQSAENIEK